MTAQQRRIKNLVKKYIRLMGLNTRTIEIRWVESEKEGTASAESEPEYNRLILTFNLAKIPQEDEANFVRHELLHAFSWELWHIADTLAATLPLEAEEVMKEMIRLAGERCTTMLEEMPVWDLLDG